MRAAKYDLIVEQGSTYNKRVQWKDSAGVGVNITGFTAFLKIKDTKKDASAIISLSIGNGITATVPASGILDIGMTAAQTAVMNFDRAVYDLLLVNGSSKYRILEGNVVLSRRVTD